MSHPIPTTEDIRIAWTHGYHGSNFPDFETSWAEFEMWLEAHDAEIRADAWDEGALWAAVETGAIRDEDAAFLAPGDNPYRAPRPPAPELIPGVQAAIDALSIYRKPTS